MPLIENRKSAEALDEAIGRDLEPKARTEEGDEFEEDPTKGETVGAQWADGPTGLAVVDVTTISGPKTPAEEVVGVMEAVLPMGATAPLADAHTPQDRAKDRAIQSARGAKQVGGAVEAAPAGAAASTPGPAPTAANCVTESPRTTNTTTGMMGTALAASVSRAAAATAAVGGVEGLRVGSTVAVSAAAAAEGGSEVATGAGAEEASGVATATDGGPNIPKPANWGSMTNTQRRNLEMKAKGKAR